MPYPPRITAWRWEQRSDRRFRPAPRRGRTERPDCLILSIHPAVIGRAFRIRSLDTVLSHISGRDGVWSATPGQIADWSSRTQPRRPPRAAVTDP